MNDSLIKQLEALSASEQRLVAQFVHQLLVRREQSEPSVAERKRRLKASFGTVTSKEIPTDESLRREYLYGEDGR